uniref:Retrovirus-related Pol polyprotein from transposon TNT 1-94 n=1 Tax=Tanacetum cinerariifolium TaxID=118510 RepID=A0A6L2MCS9_TANCI|nr:retrovirus-related Pol polyprotein from transposon TNT 1-94 [Tanacetum cinerariifolium]
MKVKAFMAIVEDEPFVGKTDARSVVFTKADESPSETAPEITSDSEFECDNQEPLSPLPKLSRAEPTGTSTDVISPVDLTMTIIVPKRTNQATDKVLSINVTKKKTQIKSPPTLDPCLDKKANLSTKQLLFTLMEEGSPSRNTLMIPKPYIDCKYYSFNYHHSDECEYYPGCDICGSIAHETANCAKKPSSNNRKPRIANRRSIKPTKKDHLRKFDEKADDGFFLSYSLVAKAFRVFKIKRQEMEETYHVTFSEDDEAISKSTTDGDEINFNENISFPGDEFLVSRSKVS